MSVSDVNNPNERRPSVSSRHNAYITITSDTSMNNKNNKVDDSRYLTAKPDDNRPRSCSPALLANVEQKSKEYLDNMVRAFTSKGTQNTKVQVGLDRYITVLKRGRSPNSAKIASMPKMSKDTDANTVRSQNRFAPLADNSTEPVTQAKSSRPPPIYLREQNSNLLVKNMISVIGEGSFYVIPLKRGNIYETKIQVNHESDYRKIVTNFEASKKNFYTYQLKSSKGLQIVIKGMDSCVDPDEVKCALQENGFKVKNVANIRNRERIPQPLFKVELEPGDIRLKKNESHPIYNLKYLLHRKITVEEPHKRSGPVQCINCQEFGHTKGYCKLPPVCVVCGELHALSQCNKSKDDSKVKKCSNCGGNHTANFRGCPVYAIVKRLNAQRSNISTEQSQHILPTQPTTYPQLPQSTAGHVSYANVLKANRTPVQYAPQTNKPTPVPISDHNNLTRIEATIETLVQTVNNFTSSMSSMMQEMMKMQSMLLQAVLSRP